MRVATLNNFEPELGNAYGDEVMCAGWNPALSQRNESSMPIYTLDADMFIKKMYDIEVNAEVFLQNMYTCQ